LPGKLPCTGGTTGVGKGAMLIEIMNSLKDILEAAITRAVKNKKKPT
jgi:hypothetical protein